MSQDIESSSESKSSNNNHMNMIINETKKLMNDIVIGDDVTRPVEDAFTYLLQDHRRLSKYIKLTEEATNPHEQAGHCEQVISSFTLHSKLEEATLYPALEQNSETHDLTEEAYAEHDLAKDLLEEIGNLEVGSDTWKAKLTVLRESIEHHVLEEEGELFPKARDILSDIEQKKLAANMEQFLQGYEK